MSILIIITRNTLLFIVCGDARGIQPYRYFYLWKKMSITNLLVFAMRISRVKGFVGRSRSRDSVQRLR